MDDDSDDSSVPDTLDEFREKWHKELNTTKRNRNEYQPIQGTTGSNQSKSSDNDQVSDRIHMANVLQKPVSLLRINCLIVFVSLYNVQAESLFMQGVELEKKGKVFEAMRMYRRAVHIDPDIEFKMYEKSKTTTKTESAAPNVQGKDAYRNIDGEDDDEDLSSVDLVKRFQASIANGNGHLFNRSNADAGVIVTDGLHIGDLPNEIILYILRWIVSSNLDLRSLEQCSMACKGFYLLARDPEIWRLACFK